MERARNTYTPTTIVEASESLDYSKGSVPYPSMQIMTVEKLKDSIIEHEDSTRSAEDQAKVAAYLWEHNYTPVSDGIKRTELEDNMEEADVDLGHSVETCLMNLRDLDYVRRWINGPQILVIHDDDGVVNGEPLEELVLEEQEELIEAIQDDDASEEKSGTAADGGEPLTLRGIAAEVLDVNASVVETELTAGEVVPDQMEKHREVVEAIEEADRDKNGEYYALRFIHNPYRYSLTTKAVRICDESD